MTASRRATASLPLSASIACLVVGIFDWHTPSGQVFVAIGAGLFVVAVIAGARQQRRGADRGE